MKVIPIRQLTSELQKQYIIGLHEELLFWRNWFETRGSSWPDQFEARTDPRIPTYDYLVDLFRPHIQNNKATTINLLDVGSGPISVLNNLKNSFPEKSLELLPADPLAEHYWGYIANAGVVDSIVLPQPYLGEVLSNTLPTQFDLVYARNSIDHSNDPQLVIMQIIKVLKLGGYAYLEHSENEALYTNYDGTHHWNFTEDEGDFIIWSRSERINLIKKMEKYCKVSVERVDTGDRHLIKLHLNKLRSTRWLHFSAELDQYLEHAKLIRTIDVTS